MAVLYTAYLDESGTHEGSEIVSVAGFVAAALDWERLSADWQTTLADYGLEYFHMADFESRQGPYAAWTRACREGCLNRLLDTIFEHVSQSIACIIPKRSFDLTMSARAKLWCGDAYGLAALGCWRTLCNTAKDPRLDGVLAVTMESGALGRHAIGNIHAEGSKVADWRSANPIRSLAFEDKRYFPPLQAADIMAYELYKQGLRQFGYETRGVRYPLRQLVRSPKQWGYPDDDELREVNRYLDSL